MLLSYKGFEPPVISVSASTESFSTNPSAPAKAPVWLAVGPEWVSPDDFPDPMILKDRVKVSQETHESRRSLLDSTQPMQYDSSASGPLGMPFPEHTPAVPAPPRRDQMVFTELDEESQQGDLSHAQWSRIEPRGRLWELCEQIGRFRREGKNRRDTATVANRVLRLASLAGVWSKKSGRERARL